MISISLKTARILSITKQYLDRRHIQPNKEGILEVIRQIGLIQIDAVNAVARNHYLVLLSRVGQYDPHLLDELVHPDHKIAEQWAHVASLLPTEDLKNLWPMILGRRLQPMRYGQRKVLGDSAQAYVKDVLKKVSEDGPLFASDIDTSSIHKKVWWNRKPARAALDWLFYCGYLMIERRIKFEPIYNLTERVFLPADLEQGNTLQDWYRWVVLRSIGCLGIGTIDHIADYYRQPMKPLRNTVDELTQEGRILHIDVDGWTEPAYLLPSDLDLIELINNGTIKPTLTTFLTPFDNLIWNRKRVQVLFGFDFRTEMYKPASQRRYGYYVMPILHLDRLVGRIIPKVDRKNLLLIIHDLLLEDTEQPSELLIIGILEAVKEIMDLLHLDKLVVKHTRPSILKQELMRINQVKNNF